MTDEPSIPLSERRSQGAAPGRMGNSPLVVTDDMRRKVRTLAKVSAAHSQSAIAFKMGMSKSTLLKYFKDDLIMGRAELMAMAGAQMVSHALRGKDALNILGELIAPGDQKALQYLLSRPGGWTKLSG